VYVAKKVCGLQILSKQNASYSSLRSIDSLWLDLTVEQYTFSFACIYRPEDSCISEEKTLLSEINSAATSNNIIVVGDFNYREITWPLTHIQHSDNRREYMFEEMFLQSNLYQMIHKPTRHREGNRSSLIDLVMTNDENLITATDHQPPVGKSDHDFLLLSMQLENKNVINTARKSTRKNYFKSDTESINTVLQNCNIFNSVCAQGTTNLKWEVFESTVLETANKYTPNTRPPRNPSLKPWIDKNIKQKIVDKRKAWDKYVLTGCKADYKHYRKLNNALLNSTRQSRTNYESRILNLGPKAFYAYIRKQLCSKVSIPRVMLDGDHTVTSEVDIANALAIRFENNYIKEPNDMTPLITYPRIEDALCDVVFTEDRVWDKLKKLREDTSMGPDGIPAVLLKKCRAVLPPLTHIMNESFSTSTVPQKWKNALVTPIYKKGDKLNPNNYRPISLTCLAVKLMEGVINDEIRQFLDKNHVIVDQQHGFMRRRSTVTNLLACVKVWSKNLDNGEPVDIIYLDYEKAFDRVPHRRLLAKLEHFGIRGKLLSWIESFLKDRKFRVRIADSLSNEFNVWSGVPQGSVISTTMFSLFVTDLQATIISNFSFFADDSKLFVNPLIDHNKLQSDLMNIRNWCLEWLINLNETKCTVLHMHRKNPKLPYILNNVQLKGVSTQQDLGVLMSNDLKWEPHISQMVKKANSIIYIIRKAFRILTPETMIKIYKTYVRPILEYGFQIWNPYFKKDIEMIEKVQRRFTKIPTQLKSLPYEERLHKLGLTTLEKRRERGQLIETFKILNGCYDCPELSDLFTRNTNTRTRGHNFKLSANKCKTNIGKNLISNRIANAWNKLPSEVVNARSVNQFKNRLDKLSKAV
jgi:hypothetical protein